MMNQPTEAVETLASVIKSARLKSGKSTREFAKDAQITQSMLMDIEKGKTVAPHPQTLRYLADATGLDLGRLMALREEAVKRK